MGRFHAANGGAARTLGALGKECVGIAGCPALLTDASLINRRDLSLAEQHAIHEQMSLADAVDVDGAQPGHIQSRVLIADDEPVARMLVRGLLERKNFQVLEAVNGKQAVDIAMRERPDLLIIDLNMPEMDGYETIARLRRDITVAATLPIVVLTSEEGPAVESRVLELGADDYIVKPFDPTVLLSRVNAVFRRLETHGE